MDCRSGHISERSYRPATDEPTKKTNLNIKGAFLHMAMDTLVSVGVVISGILISLTHYYALDAFIGMGIALIIHDFYLETLERESLPYTGCRA